MYFFGYGYIVFFASMRSITSFRKTIIFLKNMQVYAILLVDLIMEKIHETRDFTGTNRQAKTNHALVCSGILPI